jgi:hypothetical protein
VHNFCRHELLNKFVKHRALKTESITYEMTVEGSSRVAASLHLILSYLTEEEMRAPCKNQDVKSLEVYSLCPKCGHGNTCYHRKPQIKMDTKVHVRKFQMDMKAHKAKISKGEKSAPPKRNQ